MKRFKNILVVVKDDATTQDPALLRAVELARKNKATITVMTVVAAPQIMAKWYKGIATVDELTSLIESEHVTKLKTVVSSYSNEIDISVKVAIGRDFIEIVRQVLFGGHDLLIKVTNETNRSFDSNDFHLMRKSPVPVWLLKPEPGAKIVRILAAVDLAQEAYEEGQRLNTLIMDLATSLGRWEKADVHLLSCWSLYGETSLQDSAFLKISDERLASLLTEEEETNINLLNSLAARYSECKLHAQLVKGKAEVCIPKFATDNDIDVVVMGTMARSGVPGFLIGNTSESILSKIDASVITVKPDGFVSPIH